MVTNKTLPLSNLSEAVITLATIFRILTPEQILAEIEYVDRHLETPELLTVSVNLHNAVCESLVNVNPFLAFKFQSPLTLMQRSNEVLTALVNIVKRSKQDIQHPLKNAGAELFQEYQSFMSELNQVIREDNHYSIFASPAHFVSNVILVDLFAYGCPELVSALKTFSRDVIVSNAEFYPSVMSEDPNQTPEQKELIEAKLLCCIPEKGCPTYRLTGMGAFNLMLIEKLEELDAIGFITETFKQN